MCKVISDLKIKNVTVYDTMMYRGTLYDVAYMSIDNGLIKVVINAEGLYEECMVIDEENVYIGTDLRENAGKTLASNAYFVASVTKKLGLTKEHVYVKRYGIQVEVYADDSRMPIA